MQAVIDAMYIHILGIKWNPAAFESISRYHIQFDIVNTYAPVFT